MSWVLVFILGVVLVNLVAEKISILEKLGFAMPVGLGVNTFVLILLDLIGVAINSQALIVVLNLVLSVLLLGLFYWRNQGIIERLKNYKVKIDFDSLKNVNLGWLVLLGFAVYVLYAITSKALFWPVYIYDTANGYDFIAKAILREGTFDNSVFDASYPLYSVRSVYPPLVPVAFSMAYIFGATSSKIIVVFFYVSIFLVLYSFIKKYTTHYAAALFSFILAITPEFAAFSALSSPNPPCTFYNSMGLLSIYIWYKEKEKSYFAIGLLSLLLGLWTRTESVIFVATGGGVVLLSILRDKQYKNLLVYGVLSLFVFFFWQIYVKNVLEIGSVNPIVEEFTLDGEKWSRMFSQVYDVTFSLQYYGVVVYLFVVAIVVNAYYTITERNTLILLGVVLLPWLMYLGVYYIIDTDYTSGSWITAGYKRGFFYFLPLMLFYIATNKVVNTVFKKILKV